jgi:hypothetical protein
MTSHNPAYQSQASKAPGLKSRFGALHSKTRHWQTGVCLRSVIKERKVWKSCLIGKNQWSWGAQLWKEKTSCVFRVALMKRGSQGPLWYCQSCPSVAWGYLEVVFKNHWEYSKQAGQLPAKVLGKNDFFIWSNLANICWAPTTKQILLWGRCRGRYQNGPLFTHD